VKLEWSADALADLDRFARFLRRHHPHLAPIVAEEIIDAARVFVELGALTWPNGFDIDPIALHDRMLGAGELDREAAD
jgi:hypothetical protein